MTLGMTLAILFFVGWGFVQIFHWTFPSDDD